MAVGLLAVGLGACASTSYSSSAKPDITIRAYTFTPSPVKAGSTVTVHNNDSISHTVTADNGAFNVTVKSGSTTTFTAPAAPGTYKFHCNIHSSMHATLAVT